MTQKAKVFISCGQKPGRERETANAVAAVLEELGFEPYVALEEQTLKGLKENIFWNLETADYLLFIDFKREQLQDAGDGEAGAQAQSRGSLFSHQELAVASFLDLDVMAFQEEGVKREDGLMRFLQANAIPFDNPGALPGMVGERVKKLEWHPYSRNALVLTMCDPPFTDARDAASGITSRYFHLAVTNCHHRKVALNCTAYVESVIDVRTGRRSPHRIVELKWAGSSQPFAVVPPGLERQVDLGFVAHHIPNVFLFNTFTTSTQYMQPLQGPGEFELVYVVTSSAFPPARFTASVTLGSSITAANVEPR